MKPRTLCLVVCTLLLFGVAFADQQHGEPILLALKDGNTAVLDSLAKHVTENGGRIVHIYPPHVLIGFLPTAKEASAEFKFLGVTAYRGEVTGADVQQFGDVFSAVFEAWNNNFHAKPDREGLTPARESTHRLNRLPMLLPFRLMQSHRAVVQ